MSAASARAPEVHAAACGSTGAWRGLFRDRPIIPLIALLGLLVVVICSSSGPGIVSRQLGGRHRCGPPIPLAILAACQTLTMLTGGIDLSVGAVASMSGFVVATLVGAQGLVPAHRSSRSRSRPSPGSSPASASASSGSTR